MRTSLVPRVNLVSYSRPKTCFRGTRMFHSGVLFLSEMVSWSVCTRPGTDSYNQTITYEKTMLILTTFAAVTAEIETSRRELLTAALHVTALGTVTVPCAWWQRARRGQSTWANWNPNWNIVSWDHLQLLWNYLPASKLFLADRSTHMDDCGLEPLWEIQSNSTNTLSHYTLLLTVLKELK